MKHCRMQINSRLWLKVNLLNFCELILNALANLLHEFGLRVILFDNNKWQTNELSPNLSNGLL